MSVFFLVFFFQKLENLELELVPEELELPGLIEKDEDVEEDEVEEEDGLGGENDGLCFLTTTANLPVSASGGNPGGGGEPSRIGIVARLSGSRWRCSSSPGGLTWYDVCSAVLSLASCVGLGF